MCFKPASGQAFAGVRAELEELLRMSARQSGTELAEHDDSYGYRFAAPSSRTWWGAVHLVNASLEDRGFGPQLLCSVFAFGVEEGSVLLVYQYKRGSFYPFAPVGAERRGSELELRLRGVLQKICRSSPTCPVGTHCGECRPDEYE